MSTQTTRNSQANSTPATITEAQQAAYLAHGRRLRSEAIREFFAASAAYLKQGVSRNGRTNQRRDEAHCHGAQCA